MPVGSCPRGRVIQFVALFFLAFEIFFARGPGVEASGSVNFRTRLERCVSGLVWRFLLLFTHA